MTLRSCTFIVGQCLFLQRSQTCQAETLSHGPQSLGRHAVSVLSQSTYDAKQTRSRSHDEAPHPSSQLSFSKSLSSPVIISTSLSTPFITHMHQNPAHSIPCSLLNLEQGYYRKLDSLLLGCTTPLLMRVCAWPRFGRAVTLVKY